MSLYLKNGLKKDYPTHYSGGSLLVLPELLPELVVMVVVGGLLLLLLVERFRRLVIILFPLP